jgi:hypothetical protein
MEQIYNKYGIEIIKKDNKFFMKYDAGEIAVQIREIEITEDEVKYIQSKKDSKELYNYLIRNLNDRMYI